MIQSIIERVKSYKTTADGVAILTLALSLWFKPEYSKELATAVGIVWGLVKIGLQKD